MMMNARAARRKEVSPADWCVVEVVEADSLDLESFSSREEPILDIFMKNPRLLGVTQ